MRRDVTNVSNIHADHILASRWSCDIFERFVASSDAFILHVLNKTDSPDSLVDYCLLLSRLGRVEASFTLRSLLHQFVFLDSLPKVESLIDVLSR